VNNIDEAVSQLTENGCIQPLLFRFEGQMWVKLDNNAAAVRAA